jgi:hypothetical protein
VVSSVLARSNLVKLFLLATLLFAVGLQQAGAEVRVNVDRNPVQVNESFQLVFSVDQSPDRDPDFSSLQQHFLILGNSRTNSISIVNGEYQRSVKWTLKLMAKQVGEFMVPAIRFDKERSKPFQVTVQPSSLTSVPDDQLVLELIVDKPEVYVQSQVILTLRLLSATNISAYQFGKVTTEDLDVVIEPLGDERQYQTRIADRPYLVLEQKYALFPQQAGLLGIAPVRAEVRLLSGSSFDPFRTGGEIRQLRSQQLDIEVKPIPADFADRYWLPANKLELHEEWQGDLSGLVAGEPVTRSLSLIVDGLTAAQLPELPLVAITGIKQYPDQPGLENSRSASGIIGRREQKVALIPGVEGSYLVPEIKLPWWNRATGKVEIATIPARALIVNAAVGAKPDQPGASLQTSQQQSSAVTDSGNFWLWISLMLAAGWILSALYWWYRSIYPVGRASTRPEHPQLPEARKKLRLACEANDAENARHALLLWGRALMAPQPVTNLLQLGQMVGGELTDVVKSLNLSLYSEAQTQWRGQELWILCQQLEKSRAASSASDKVELSALNPGPPGTG